MRASDKSKKVLVLAILAVLLSATTLFVALAPTWGGGAIAPVPRQQVEPIERPQVGQRLPGSVARAVQRHLSRLLDVPRRQLAIKSYRATTWRDGCLGLPATGEICNQALVRGWQVEVTHGNQTWVYRTDRNGRRVRLDQQSSPVSAETVQDAAPPTRVLQAVQRAASDRTQENLRILQAEAREWSDGCLGLASSEEICSQEIVPGWRITVEAGDQQRWVYRTDSTGSRIRLEPEASGLN